MSQALVHDYEVDFEQAQKSVTGLVGELLDAELAFVVQ